MFQLSCNFFFFSIRNQTVRKRHEILNHGDHCSKREGEGAYGGLAPRDDENVARNSERDSCWRRRSESEIRRKSSNPSRLASMFGDESNSE